MSMLKNSLRCGLFWGVVIFVLGSHAQAQTPQPLATPAPDGRLSADEASALRELLNEVHLLRLAIQSAAAGGKRIQLAAERVRLQQERVDKAVKDLDDTRNQLADLKANQLRVGEALKELERQSRQEAFPARRAARGTRNAAQGARKPARGFFAGGTSQIERLEREAQCVGAGI